MIVEKFCKFSLYQRSQQTVVLLTLFALCTAIPACNRKPAIIDGEQVDTVKDVAPNVPSHSTKNTNDSTSDHIDSSEEAIKPAFSFSTIGPESGLEFTRQDDIRGQRRIIESTGGGVAMLDIDADGLLDLFFTGGCRVPEELNSDAATCSIFRNRGDAKFQLSTEPSRLLMPGYCQGCAVGDIDNDGFDDLYITAFGRNGLWRNNGDGTFDNITEHAGVQDLSWGTGCAFADLNVDGNLDLYVVNYLQDSPEAPLLCPNKDAPEGYEQCPPSHYEGVTDKLFIADGIGGFIDATESSGLAAFSGKGLGVVVSDLDRNGLPEIYVANDGQANFLFAPTKVTSTNVVYTETALASGCALNSAGYAQASMGIATGDYDQNGTIDLLLTHFIRDSNTLYSNQGELQFTDVTRRSGLLGPSKPVLGWGTIMEDLDGDGLLDLFVVNGHVEDRRWMKRGEPYAMKPQAFRNQGSGQFKEVFEIGQYFDKEWLGRGVAAGDLNGDGRVDFAVSHQLEKSVALINRAARQLTPLTIRLIGVRSNRSAIGAKVSIENINDNTTIYREIVGGGSFLSASAREIHLAIPPVSQYQIAIQWPGSSDSAQRLQWQEFIPEAETIVIRQHFPK